MFGQAQKPLFGATQAQGNTPNMFGSQATNQQQPTGMFGQANAPGAAPGLFGQTSSQNTQAPQPTTGGLFGQSSNQQQQPNLFGSNTNQQQPQQTTSLFGQNNTQQQSSNLFGQTQNQPKPATSLFGQSTTAAAAPATSLFGQSTANSGLFNQSTTAAPIQGVGLFGQNQQAPAANNSIPVSITLSTKYSELNQATQQELDNMEKFIQSQIQQSSSMAARSISEPLSNLEKDSLAVKRKLAGLHSLLKRDGYVIDGLKGVLSRELRSSDLISRYIENHSGMDYKSSAQHDAYSNYFANFCTDLESRMNQCRHHIEELEMNIRSSTQANQLTPSVIEEIIKSQYYSFMAVASKVALVHDATLKAKELLEQYQAKHGTGNIFRGSTNSNKESFAQMASLLVPSGQSGNSQQVTGSIFNNSKSSTLGTSMFNTKPASNGILGSSTGTGMFGNTNNVSTPGTGLFGNTSSTGTPSTGLFGNNTSTTNTALNNPNTGLFVKMPVILLETEKWDIFKEAISIIFFSWTALRLATESDEQKCQELVELTFEYFKDGAVEVDHLEYNFYEWFADECNVEIEDGSMLLVAQDLLDIFQEIMNGYLVNFNLLKESYSKSSAAEQAETMEIIEQPAEKEKIIDEDGFELVQRRRK